MAEVTLSIPDDILQHAERLSKVTRFDVSNILIDALAFTLPTLDGAMAAAAPVDQLDDKEVLALSESQMSVDKDERLSELLFKQRERQISVDESAELLSLMLMYYSGWWHKTEALVEAVKRKLRPPLEP